MGADNKIADPILEDPSGLNRSRVSIVTRRGVIISEMGLASFHPLFVVDAHKIFSDHLLLLGADQ